MPTRRRYARRACRARRGVVAVAVAVAAAQPPKAYTLTAGSSASRTTPLAVRSGRRDFLVRHARLLTVATGKSPQRLRGLGPLPFLPSGTS
jgi:hypothetical protein